jgi:hypothetical protein
MAGLASRIAPERHILGGEVLRGHGYCPWRRLRQLLCLLRSAVCHWYAGLGAGHSAGRRLPPGRVRAWRGQGGAVAPCVITGPGRPRLPVRAGRRGQHSVPNGTTSSSGTTGSTSCTWSSRRSSSAAAVRPVRAGRPLPVGRWSPGDAGRGVPDLRRRAPATPRPCGGAAGVSAA